MIGSYTPESHWMIGTGSEAWHQRVVRLQGKLVMCNLTHVCMYAEMFSSLEVHDAHHSGKQWNDRLCSFVHLQSIPVEGCDVCDWKGEAPNQENIKL